MTLSPGRLAQLAREKVNYPTSRTRGELRRLLGLSDSTMDRYIKSGKIPEPTYHSLSGWPLWSAEQTRALIIRMTERGRL